MQDQLSGLDSTSLAERAYRRLRDLIVEGALAPGERVTERGLAERLSVSPTPVREAIKRLEADGLLERKSPRTVCVAASVSGTPQQLAEVEVALRGLVARLAAVHATDADIAHLTRLLDAAEDQTRLYAARVAEGLPIDGHAENLYASVQQFNAAVLASTHNPVLIRLFEQTRALSSVERRKRSVDRLRKDPTFGRSRWESHRSTLDAIRAHDPERAERIAIERAQSAMRDLAGNLPGDD
ncbi:DNA-binding transcriptional regulator, GntR family [Thermomonospora echinospora]|uniref:DNA-binding transcriptional regulator, GntR family n=1 Tax=Thermomonospora echinospora TaxID=1992 RepID=A0A1H6E522_9ACTN|nr:GntR family transcriptional regulator [Thermomonospora echinospora]SEG92790.1 DNA-binding transcriptional regulator, GntR family [Thermomonospora echinospora]